MGTSLLSSALCFFFLTAANAFNVNKFLIYPPSIRHGIQPQSSIPFVSKARTGRNNLSAPFRQLQSSSSSSSKLANNGNNGADDKFSFPQRIESSKAAVIGLLAGGVALSPFSALHDIAFHFGGPAQWEFDTDMGSLQGALFGIVYRYAVREDGDTNPMLSMGVIAAFVFVRTFARIQVPTFCSAAPLDCGEPLGYFDWSMLGQLILNGFESVALFGAAAAALEFCFRRGFVSKVP